MKKKTSLSNYMLTSDFNTKSTDLETKINANGAEVTSLKSDLSSYAKKADAADNITKIKNDYVTNASLTSQLNDLKSQHIPTEVKSIDDKTKKSASDILVFESRLKQKEDIIDKNQRGLSFNRGFFYYMDQSHLIYNCKIVSFNFTGVKISTWKSTGILNYLVNFNMNAVSDSRGNLPDLKYNEKMYVCFSGNHFQQNKALILNNISPINIYCVYELQSIALFGAMQITKNADTSKYNYKGYGICFDEGGTFSKGGINIGRNV